MSKQCSAKWTFLVVLAVGLLQTTNSIESVDCDILNKSCKLVTECVSAIDLVKSGAYDPLRKMYCGHDVRGPKVCCPIDSPIVFTNDTQTATSINKSTATENASIATTTEKVNQYGLPSREVCGLVRSSQDRIVGGVIASLEEFPWIARIKKTLLDNTNKPGKFNCGGSLISDRYVLTAAHCVPSDVELYRLSVRLGEWDTETVQDCQDEVCSDPPVDINVTKTILHPSYEFRTLQNDIAILKLENAVNFTDFIRPVCLPSTEYARSQDYVAGTMFWVAGWGVTEFGSESIVKRKISLDTVPMDVCITKMSNVRGINQSNIICAGGKIGKDTCFGDSGGPLVKEISHDQVNWYLYGIVSFGAKRCGVTDTPSVYTRVTAYMDWIKENIAS